jgi:hypothetical protein
MRTRDELRRRRALLARAGARGFRLETLQIAILGIEQDIREHCAQTNLPLPEGIPDDAGSRTWFRSDTRAVRYGDVL